MLFSMELALLLMTIFVVWRLVIYRNRKNLPPGEWGWPVIGYIKPTNESMQHTLQRLRKKHGDTFSWQMGGRTFVFLNKYQTMKSVLNGPDVINRPDFYSFRMLTNNEVVGIFNSGGEMWQHNRRFTMRHLRDLGFGKSSMENNISLESKALVEDFHKYLDKPGKLPNSLSLSVLNVIWSMTADIRFPLDDPEVNKFRQMVLDLLLEFQGNVVYFDQFPFLEHIVPEFGYGAVGIKTFVESSKTLCEYVAKTVEAHKKNLDSSSPRDFIDHFLIDWDRSKDDGHGIFTDANLVGVIIDLFTAGGETTTVTLRWILHYLAKHPDIQEKVQREIDSVVPRDQLPGVEHRSQLNYTEAVFHEVQRIVSLAPLTFGRVSARPINIDGYTIPTDAVIIGNVEGCHFDPEFWEKPNEFYPEHFLDGNGKFKLQKEGYAPFSIGKRICPGESLSKLNLFLFGSALLQSFSFNPAPGETLPTEHDVSDTFFHMIKDCDFIITKRK